MSISNRVGNIFAQADINVVVHQCNVHHTFGAGIARIIRENYPYAYDADLATVKGDKSKVGTFSVGKPKDGVASSTTPFFVNMYSQENFGEEGRDTRYDAMADALKKLEKSLSKAPDKYVLGIPYGMGAGLARGSWHIITAIIEDVFYNSPVKVVICRIPSQLEFPPVKKEELKTEKKETELAVDETF